MSIFSKKNVWCLVALYFALVQAVFSQNKYCMNEVEYCFTITLPQPQDNEGLVHFRLEAPNTTGWIGLGVGENMNGYLMVAWPNSDGTITLSQRKGEGIGVQPTVTNSQDLVLLNTSNINQNQLVVEFTRPLIVQQNTIETKQQNFEYAYSSTNPENSDSAASLPIHDYSSNILLNLEEGDSEWSRYDKLIIAHGSLMFAAYLIITPGAIFIARFARRILPTTWFKLHVVIQVFLSTPVILAGSSLVFAAAENLNLNGPHKIIGFVLFLGFFVQLAIGAIHHHLYDPKRTHVPWWTKLHWWFGRALIVLAIFQIQLGLNLYGSDVGYYYGYYIYLFLLIVAFSFLSFRLWNKSRGSDNGFKRMAEA